jgi:Zn-dependent protease with chaperone function
VADFLAQAMLHGFIAALVVEALLRVWAVEDADQRVRLRLLALCLPLVLPPALQLLAPFRAEEWFRERFALFSVQRWRALQLFGVSLYWLWLASLTGAGGLLFLLDFVPYVKERLAPRRIWPAAVDVEETPVGPAVRELARALWLEPPRAVFLQTDPPVLFVACPEGRVPHLVLSRGVLELLDARELKAALAHELGHLSQRDPWLSWLLMAVRSLLLFSPVSQVLVRAIARDAERRADDLAAALTQDPFALAGGLLKLFRLAEGSRLEEEAMWGTRLTRARSAAVVERCRRLLDGRHGAREGWGRTRVALVGLSLGGLLFFVV